MARSILASAVAFERQMAADPSPGKAQHDQIMQALRAGSCAGFPKVICLHLC